MIHHEPFGLKDENQFICEIKQSKSYVSNMGIHDETQHALNQKREIEEHLKVHISPFCMILRLHFKGINSLNFESYAGFSKRNQLIRR